MADENSLSSPRALRGPRWEHNVSGGRITERLHSPAQSVVNVVSSRGACRSEGRGSLKDGSYYYYFQTLLRIFIFVGNRSGRKFKLYMNFGHTFLFIS